MPAQHVVFVDNLILPGDGGISGLDVHPHLGLISLASVLRDNGYLISIVDPKRLLRDKVLSYNRDLYSQLAESILSLNPAIIGFTALGCSFLFAQRVASEIRLRCRDIPILLGGPHATILHREILARFTEFDVIVRHEAELVLPEVLIQLDTRRFNGIPGISWRTSSTAGFQMTEGQLKVSNLDTLPIGDYSKYPISELDLDLMRIEAGRGCPFQCTFCSTASYFHRSYRIKSASRLVDEMDHLNRLYGAERFALSHDLFTVNRKKVLQFCAAVSSRGYKWRVSARMDCIDSELIKEMSDAGCENIYFGVETGSARMQKITKKNMDLSLVTPTLDTLSMAKIGATTSFIFGYPEESDADQRATIRLIGQIEKGYPNTTLTQLHVLVPEPGTELLDKYRHRLAFDNYDTGFNALIVDEQDQAIVQSSPELFSSYHYYEGDCPRHRNRHIFEIWKIWCLIPSVARSAILNHVGDLDELFFEVASRLEHSEHTVSDCLIASIAHRFGQRHSASSIIRYSLAVLDLKSLILKHPNAEIAMSDHKIETQALSLSKFCRLLRGLDMEALQSCGAPVHSDFPADSLLLMLTPDGIAHFQVTASVVDLVEHPEAFSRYVEDGFISNEFSESQVDVVRHLLKVGVLEHSAYSSS